jgi:ribose/xylose/arabinose/galactoside ABC-type transport system permease subunit
VITGIITNALVLFGIDGNWQQVATGVLILAAVMLNQVVARRAGRG